MISLDELKKKGIEIRVVGIEERLTHPAPLKEKIRSELKDNLYTIHELIEKTGTDRSHLNSAIRKMEKDGILLRLVIDGILYVGLTEDVRVINS